MGGEEGLVARVAHDVSVTFATPPRNLPEEYTSLYDEGYGGQEPWTSSSGPSDWLTERQLRRMRALYAADWTHNAAIHLVDPEGRLVDIFDLGDPARISEAVLRSLDP